MLRCALLLVLASGCASVRPAAAPDVALRVDPPVPLTDLVHPDAMRRFVPETFEGHPVRLENAQVRTSGHETTSAAFLIEDGSWMRFTLNSERSTAAHPSPDAGPDTLRVRGRRTTAIQDGLLVWVDPTRSVSIPNTARGRALLDQIDLDSFAAFSEPVFLEPRSGSLWETAQAAADSSKRLAARVPGTAILPDALASALPDTAGLGLPQLACITTQPVWQAAVGLSEDSTGPRPVITGARLDIAEPGCGRAWASITAYAASEATRDVLPVELAARLARPDTIRVGDQSVQRWPDEPAHNLRSRYSVSLGPGRWAVAAGADTTLALRLLSAIRPTAFDGLVPVPVLLARTPFSYTDTPGGGVLATGIRAETDGRVSVSSGEYRPWQPTGVLGRVEAPRPFSFVLPDAWMATGTVQIHCIEEWGPTLAVLTHAPLDPCSLRSYSGSPAEFTIAERARSGSAVLVRAVRPAALAPMAWFETWPGFAESLLPWWSAGFSVSRPPQFENESLVTLATDGPGLHVEAAYVRVSDWLIGIVGLGPPADSAALRAAVEAVARSLQPVP